MSVHTSDSDVEIWEVVQESLSKIRRICEAVDMDLCSILYVNISSNAG